MKPSRMPDALTLHELLIYNATDGKLAWRRRPRDMFSTDREWRRWNTRYAGTPALAHLSANGYPCGKIGGKGYLAHRIIWKMETGKDPSEELDHVDGCRSNNRTVNLREVTRGGNCRNQKRRSNEAPGVYWYKAGCKWRAEVNGGKSRVYLGQFDTHEEAVVARKAAEHEHGYHHNHGRTT